MKEETSKSKKAFDLEEFINTHKGVTDMLLHFPINVAFNSKEEIIAMSEGLQQAIIQETGNNIIPQFDKFCAKYNVSREDYNSYIELLYQHLGAISRTSAIITVLEGYREAWDNAFNKEGKPKSYPKGVTKNSAFIKVIKEKKTKK